MDMPLEGVRRKVADLGLAMLPPVFIVWGKQREPLRRWGPRLITIREDLFAGSDELLMDLVRSALADPTVGTDWEPDRRPPGYYEPKRKNS